MSASSLANYLLQRTHELKLSKSEVAKRAKISRQTWYRLLNSDVTQAKLTTFVRIAAALNTHPSHLIQLYFHDSSFCSYKASHCDNLTNGFISDITCPNNSSVVVGETFTKIWRVTNIKDSWVNMFLQCIDENQNESINDFLLTPKLRIVSIPDTIPGETIDIAVTFKAPKFPGTIISEWVASDCNHTIQESGFGTLRCLVKVVSM